MTEADAQIKVFWRQRSRIVVKYCGNTANIYYHVTRPPLLGRYLPSQEHKACPVQRQETYM